MERLGIPLNLMNMLLLLMGLLECLCTSLDSSSSRTFNLNSNDTKQLFNDILSQASDECEGKRFYNYNSFIAAANTFPGFGATGTSETAKREVAAFFAHVVFLVGDLCYVNALNSAIMNNCDPSNATYPCVKGKSYHGRGPIQLSWNYNYGPAGKYLKFDGLGKPDLLSTNATISFQTSIWFWMMNSNCHAAIVSDQGFIGTVRALDEQACEIPSNVNLRVNSYKSYCKSLGVDPGSKLGCNSERAASEPAAGPVKGETVHVGGRKHSKNLIRILSGTIVGTTSVSLLLLSAYYLRFRRRKRLRLAVNVGEHGDLGRGEGPPLVYFNYEKLKGGTKGFNAGNKLGEGGFGEVYKCILQDGIEVAVKKLFVRRSTQAMAEFHTEIKAISGVLHRNLVRLLGYCTQGDERLLVYEFLPNKSLDMHLFGDRGIYLNWEARFQIITGTARGLAYLHEHSHVRIIHRDIKPGNILLDENLQPKIADFGLAKLFPEDKTHLTTRVGGTVGYTAPEYAVHGLLTQKADVYSYGVVTLEILSGRRCMDTRLPSPVLLQLAWSLYESNERMNVVDSKLEVERMSQREQGQILRVIHIALLCVQGSSNQRPSMSNVLSMLTTDSEILGVPTAPAFIDSDNKNLPSDPSAEMVSAPPQTSHASMTNSLIPR